jgi:hypothetical protein
MGLQLRSKSPKRPRECRHGASSPDRIAGIPEYERDIRAGRGIDDNSRGLHAKRRVKAQLREYRSPVTAPNQVWAMDFVSRPAVRRPQDPGSDRR